MKKVKKKGVSMLVYGNGYADKYSYGDKCFR